MDEAVVRIVLQDDGGSQPPPSQSAPVHPPTRPQQGQPAPTPTPATVPTPPRAQPVDARAIDSYQGIARAVNLAKKDADAFSKSMEGVQGQLFKLRHGVDPQAIANVFVKGGAAAQDFLKKLTEINVLVGQGAVGQTDRLQLVKGEITSAATNAAAASTVAKTTGGEPDWVKHLIEGVEGANRHVLIEGQSGSGKSLMTRHIAFERMKRGEEVHVIDPHTPEQWKGAKSVFTRDTAATDASAFLRDTIRGREKERVEAKARGEDVDFKPLTVVFSDFARLLKDAPKLGDEMRTLLTEARKFNIAIIADTTALTGAETGVKGIQNIRRNFAQQVTLSAPTSTDPNRTAQVGGQKFVTPMLPDYKDRLDPSIIRTAAPPPPPPPEPQFDPMVEARKQREAERRRAQVRASYKEQFGEDASDTNLNRVLGVVGQFRGVIGGFTGALIGAGLDAVAAFRKAQVEVDRRKRDERLIAEVQTEVSAAKGAEKAEVATAPTEPSVAPTSVTDALVDAVQVAEPQTPPAQSPQAAAQPPAASPVQHPHTPAGKPAAAKPSVPQATPASGPATVAAKAAAPAATAAATSGAAGAAGTAAGTVASTGAAASGATAMGGAAMAAAGPLIAVGAAAVGAVIAVKAIAGAMTETTDRLSQYNAQIAMATARAEVRQIYGDIRRADQAAPTLSRFTDAQSQLVDKTEDLKVNFFNMIGPAITEILNATSIVIEILNGIMTVCFNIRDFVANLPIINELVATATAIWNWIKARFGITEGALTGENDPVQVILNDLFANINEAASY